MVKFTPLLLPSLFPLNGLAGVVFLFGVKFTDRRDELQF
jgi:hypothetical protein